MVIKKIKNCFPITTGANNYLISHNLSVSSINGILSDVLLKEYLDYVNIESKKFFDNLILV